MQATRCPGTLAQRAAAAAAQLLGSPHDYSAALLRRVQFCADKVHARDSDSDGSDDAARTTLVFPWRVTAEALNGFQSAHGGALSTLADVFTTLHARSALAGDSADAATSPPRRVRTVGFDINFLNAIYEGKECVCVTRLLSAQPDAAVFVEFAIEDAQSSELVYTRGTHVLALSH